MTTFLDQTQDYNPLTWEIQLNPAAWWLSVQDIDSAASIELKSSLYSGNLNLTADQYREVQSLVQTKYSGVDYTGMIKGGGMTPDISMTGRDPGLYMNQERFGYWKDDIDQWKAYIANNGNFAFKGNATNYISWDGSILTIRGALNLDEAWDPITTEVYYGDILGAKPPVNADVTLWAINGGLAITGWGLQLLSGWAAIKGGQSAYNTGSGFWLGDVSWTTKFSIGNGTKWITWDGSAFNVRWILYAESWTFTGSITSSATITGWTLQTASTGARLVLGWSTIQSIDSTGNLITINSSNNQIWFQNGVNTAYLRFRLNTWVANLETDAIFRSYAAIYCSGLDTWQINASGTIFANSRLKIPVWTNLY